MGGLQIFYPVNPPRGVYSGGFTADNIDGPYGIPYKSSLETDNKNSIKDVL